MKIYSPSQTKSFLECPRKWYLERQGWAPKTYSKMNLYGIRGNAVSAALDMFNTVGKLDLIESVITDAVNEEYTKLNGREWREFKSQPLTRTEIAQQAFDLVAAYVASLPQPFTVKHSEYTFKKHGYARADVIGESFGRLFPVDYKCKDIPVQSYYEQLAKQEYRYDWQLMHYCLAVSQEFGIDCLNFGIVLLWYGKKCRIEYINYNIAPERFKLWYSSAVQVWGKMEACEKDPALITEVADHRTKFGMCPFANACLVYNLNEDRMKAEYGKRH